MSLYGALAYNYEKVAAGTAEILSGNRMISDRLGLPSEDMRLALLSFENYLLANRNTEKPVLHISPVSYTHLDVYKRQKLVLLNSSCKCVLSVNEMLRICKTS